MLFTSNIINLQERRNNNTHERLHKTEILGTMNQKYYKGEVKLQGLHQVLKFYFMKPCKSLIVITLNIASTKLN